LIFKRAVVMELKWLEDFLTLCRLGNFRISSEQRFVSQPAFSRRIKSLETWLGASLIDRSSQPVQLTEAGIAFKPVAQEIVRLASQSLKEIKNKSRHDGATIRFSTFNSLAQFFMPAWLKQLHPLIETELFSVRADLGTVDDHLRALEEGVVDFFICYEEPGGTLPGDAKRFDSLQLGTEKLVPVVSPDNAGNPAWWLPDRPKGAIPYLHITAKTSAFPVKNHIQKHYSDLNFQPVFETSHTSALKAMAIEGYGVAWVPHAVVADDLKKATLVRAARRNDDIPVNIKIYKSAANHQPGVEKFWHVLRNNASN